ncbi:putative protein phosphatase 2C-type [Symmachiella macrocystis]|uniref:PPM-type phosphatase domain-containing protein n=1 Tax=Symmachiella macrocystis TaxID=2527985 RepID=A0A5C6B673_9PLAN|nr:protein phosphatase 2C domain-containing protein [Symmachiella macrocystis]TWU06819.1 putative protein phosphatase 2C-type [Symmachiella macrocystis]
MMNLSKMDCFAKTDMGRRRAENDDQYLVADLVKAVRIQSTSLSYDDYSKVSGDSQGKVLLVADGLGNPAAGSRASTLAVDETINCMVNRMYWSAFGHAAERDDQRLLFADLVTALKSCQRRIHDEAEWNVAKQGMGTTLTVAIVNWPALHVVHVGDSRCYLSHDGELQQVTQDHTLAQARVDAGECTIADAQESLGGGALWNVVGGKSPDIDPKVYNSSLSIGDTLLLCTDGLHKHVTDDEIADILHKRHSAREVCEDLVNKANAAGGADNITVAVARFHDTKQKPLVQDQEVAQETGAAELGGGEKIDSAPQAATIPVATPSKVVSR